MNWLCNSDIVNLMFKTNGGRDRMSNFVILVAWREYFNCWWVGGGGLGQKILFMLSALPA